MTGGKGSNNTVVTHLVGDVGPRRVEYGESPDSLFANVHQKIKEADVRFCQLEWDLATKGCMQWRDRPTTWYGRAHPDNVKSLVHAGFDVVSRASNHGFDYGPEAVLETLDVLRNHGMQVIGAGKDIAEARRPAIVERKGIRVGFLAYNCVLPPEYEAREEKPGVAPIKVATYYEMQEFEPGTPPLIVTIPREGDVLAMEEDVRRLRAQVDAVIVSIHWGIHFVPGALAMYQPVLGHRVIDAGADLIFGHHPHILKGIEVYKGRAIFYSVGSFALETPHHLKPPPGVKPRRMSLVYRQWSPEPGSERFSGPRDKSYTMMVRCVIGKDGVQKVSFLPGWVNQRAEPEFLARTDPRFDEVLRYIDPWCRELGATLAVEGDEVVVQAARSKGD
ncbi:MAG: CapA family protein [Chloroflexi bacterium]|nr:CapA family protein [Chloroflexota bacterium]